MIKLFIALTFLFSTIQVFDAEAARTNKNIKRGMRSLGGGAKHRNASQNHPKWYPGNSTCQEFQLSDENCRCVCEAGKEPNGCFERFCPGALGVIVCNKCRVKSGKSTTEKESYSPGNGANTHNNTFN